MARGWRVTLWGAGGGRLARRHRLALGASISASDGAGTLAPVLEMVRWRELR